MLDIPACYEIYPLHITEYVYIYKIDCHKVLPGFSLCSLENNIISLFFGYISMNNSAKVFSLEKNKHVTIFRYEKDIGKMSLEVSQSHWKDATALEWAYEISCKLVKMFFGSYLLGNLKVIEKYKKQDFKKTGFWALCESQWEGKPLVIAPPCSVISIS